MKKRRANLWNFLTMAAALLLLPQVLVVADAEAQSTKSKPTPKSVNVALPMSIASFLEQVASGNDAYKAAELNRRAAAGYSGESSLMLAPTLVASARTASDGKPSQFSSLGFSYQSIDTTMYSAGISKQFAMGLKTSFSYAAFDTNIVGLARPKFFEARPQLEFTMPLWRNFWGSETMGAVEAGRLGALAKAEGQDALAKSLMAEAEAAYWRLALAREAVKVSRDSVERAQAMFDWTRRRVRLALSDRSEHLSSTAQLKARELDLKITEDEERAARLQFNSARGINSDKVSESLEVLNAALVAKWETPSRTKTRPDIEAERLRAEAAEANAKMSAERSKPSLELTGLYAFNSPQRGSQAEAVADSWQRDRPSSEIGVRLNMPLDFGTMRRSREGWAAEASASRTLMSRKLFEQERDWYDVVARFHLAKEKIRLFEELEASQREKLEHERSRQKAGRSTVAQVILFETDYEQTQFSRIRALAEVLNLNAQMKLYGVAYETKTSPDTVNSDTAL